MNRARNLTNNTISRSRCHLRTHRCALIKLSTRQKSIAQEKHHAYRPNAGKADTAPSLTGALQRVCQIRPQARTPYKSP